MKPFHRRYYSNLSQIKEDFQFLLSRRQEIKAAMSGDRVSKSFRERLMLVVTQVNDCKYCRSFHTSQAFQAGILRKELLQLLSGLIPDDAPDDQIPALMYARHWAERDAHPKAEADQQLRETYGDQTYGTIQVILRMIRMGNLLGNTWDYLIYRISFGRLGNRRMPTRLQ